MKLVKSSVAFAFAALLGLGATRSMANGTTETVSNGVVVNSTYTFSNAKASGIQNFILDGTTLANLGSHSEPVTLQLVLTSITYTDPAVFGLGVAPTITFSISPNLGNLVSGLPSTTVTLTAAPIPFGQIDTNVVFSLATPITFAPVTVANTHLSGEATGGTWKDSLTDLQPTPDYIITGNGFSLDSVQNQNFSFSGSVEVFYGANNGSQLQAAPEPRAWLLGAVAMMIFVGLARSRRVWQSYLSGAL
ncbi:MAG TPA: hypothetical protein VGC39_11790 [Candidatus Methylacidiphilales bacterium]